MKDVFDPCLLVMSCVNSPLARDASSYTSSRSYPPSAVSRPMLPTTAPIRASAAEASDIHRQVELPELQVVPLPG